MIRFLADENFDRRIVRGVLRREPSADIVRVQDVALDAADDPTVLAWAAEAGRVLLTHDVRTVSAYAWERVARADPMPGVLEVRRTLPIRTAVEEIVTVIACSTPDEWAGQVHYLPLR